MLRILLVAVGVIISPQFVTAQIPFSLKDSITINGVVPRYDSVSNRHRAYFGENYRKEWAVETRLPIIKISSILGGLKPTELGGGHQSHSLRLKDKMGKEWVLRSVRKYSEGLAPEMFKGSIYEKWLDDNFSAQHPYSALIVPVLADAVKVPHTNPVIGWVAPDEALGEFAKDFAGTICLLEEREPLGDSDNSVKMLEKLDEDNDNKLDSAVFFRARMLDLLIADWGRHEDQWRWVDKKAGDGKDYLVIPRDRDQVLYVNEGLLPGAASSVSLLSFLEGFNSSYKDPNAFFINGRNLNQQFLNQYSYESWMKMAREFVNALPDEVLRLAVRQLPASSYQLKGESIFTTLKGRRDNLLNAMDTYYRFLYGIVDIRTSDKAEIVELSESDGRGINLLIHKADKSGDKEQVLFNNTFKPEITREIRLFIGEGNDIIKINAPSSPIKIRIVGGEGMKKYSVIKSASNIHIYEDSGQKQFQDPENRLSKHISSDTLNLRKVFSNLYHGSGITPTGDLRSVDGISLGLQYKIEKEGFRKLPYGSLQKIKALHSLSTKSFVIEYNGEWKEVFRNTDFNLNALADMKGNILNFFGRGNETMFDQTGDYRTFYRVNFSLYELKPALTFKLNENSSLTAGPSFQYFVNGSNTGRYFSTPAISSSYANLYSDKLHGGMVLNLNWDNRDNKLLPSKGLNFDLRLQGFEGLNNISESFAQVFSQFSFYIPFDKKGNFVIANRIGGGLTAGTTTFYQSAFLGSQDNLLGFRKNRFAGDHVAYNNLEARLTLPNFLQFVMPGKIGLVGFYDAGRVWIKNDNSKTIHQGWGGGIFISPLNRLVIRGVAGFSNEGLQPTVALRQRF